MIDPARIVDGVESVFVVGFDICDETEALWVRENLHEVHRFAGQGQTDRSYIMHVRDPRPAPDGILSLLAEGVDRGASYLVFDEEVATDLAGPIQAETVRLRRAVDRLIERLVAFSDASTAEGANMYRRMAAKAAEIPLRTLSAALEGCVRGPK